MTERELVEVISNKFPISAEDAELFIKGAQSGYLSPTLDSAIALAFRDKKIKSLQKENKYLRSKWDMYMQNGLRNGKISTESYD